MTDYILDLDEYVNSLSSDDNITRLTWARPLSNAKFREVLQDDVAYAVFSVTFVVLYIWFHLESFFMASLSMLLILLSFPFSYFIYTGIF